MSATEPRIKLLILTPSLKCGGSEKYVALLCNHIDTVRFDTTLAVLDNADRFYDINPDVKVIDLNVKQVKNAFFKIRNIVNTVQPDIIYSNGNHLNLYLAIFKNLLIKQRIVIARESSVVSSNSKRAKFPGLYNWLLKRFYHRLHFIVCQSHYMQQDLIAGYNVKKEQTFILNNPVEATQQLVRVPQKNKFITVARLSEEKGIDRLLAAVQQLTMPFTYYIIGNGNQKAALQQLIDRQGLNKNVFIREQNNTPFSGMEDAALFLMGSYYEGFPNTLLEAGALGIPAVVFDVPGGVNEIITNGENGIIVKENDSKAFAVAIEKAMHINFNRQQIQAETLQKFSLNPIIKKTEDLFIRVYHANQ